MVTLFDIIVFTIITASSMLGIYSGVVKLTISSLGFVSSIFAAYLLYPYTVEIITEYSNNEVVVATSSGVISYIISLIICTFLTRKLLLIVSTISGGVVDRLLGLLAGLIRGLVICLILFLIITIFTSNSYLKAETLEDVAKNTTKDQYPEWLKKSLTLPYLDDLNRNIIAFIPQHVLKSIKLPKEPETVNITNVLEKAHQNKKSSDNSVLSQDLKHELEQVLSKENKYPK